MQELNIKEVLLVSGGSVGDYWGVGDGTPAEEGQPLEPVSGCVLGVIGGAIGGAAGGLKGLILGIIGGGIAGGCTQP